MGIKAPPWKDNGVCPLCGSASGISDDPEFHWNDRAVVASWMCWACEKGWETIYKVSHTLYPEETEVRLLIL